MAKLVMLIVISCFMASCASQSDRGISSVDKKETDHNFYERTGMGDRF